MLGILTIQITNLKFKFLDENKDENKVLEMSLNIYKNSNVYYRTGKYSDNNLEPIFVSISKRHQSVVYEESSENDTIINGKADKIMCSYASACTCIIIQIMFSLYIVFLFFTPQHWIKLVLINESLSHG